MTRVGTQKPIAEINDTYSAMAKLKEDEQALYDKKLELAKRHEELTGNTVPAPPKPVHMLNTPGPATATLSLEKAKVLLTPFTALPQMMGCESTINTAAMDQWAMSVVEMSKHYNMDVLLIDWAMFIGSTMMVFAPIMGEKKAKKNGTWDSLRQEYVKQGWVKPANLRAVEA